MNKKDFSTLFFSKTRDFLDKYEAQQLRRSENTIESYRDGLTSFRRFITNEKKKSMLTFTFSDCTNELVLDYMEYLQKCRYQDVYHKALIYCLGLNSDTRDHVDRIYDFKEGYVKPECLYEGWQTSGSMKVVRMAYNLYCNGTPSVLDIEDAERKLEECSCYTVEELFCCGYARYFWEAIKIRYPEYCFYQDWEDMYAEN